MADYTYEHVITQFGKQLIRRVQDGAFIPADPNNCDFLYYKQWVASGNTPATVNYEIQPKPAALDAAQGQQGPQGQQGE